MTGDVVAIAGIAGTLLGTALGAWVTWKIQARQLEHEDKTRFHDQRLATYAEFGRACNAVMAALLVPGAPHPTADLLRATTNFQTLRLIASKPVFDAATAVHSAVTDAVQGRNANLSALMPQFNNAVATMAVSMRTELGTPG